MTWTPLKPTIRVGVGPVCPESASSLRRKSEYLNKVEIVLGKQKGEQMSGRSVSSLGQGEVALKFAADGPGADTVF